MLDFRYFQGPQEHMSNLASEPVACHFCGSFGDGFELDFSICALSDEEKEGRHGCVRCLSEGRFEFWHDTDIGVLDENGLKKVYKHNGSAPADFSRSALVALRRTPQIVTWQQELWLSHCSDFMVYIGTWGPADFERNAPDGDARALFLRMTRDPGLQFLWDECLVPHEKIPGSWNATYYAFKCSHCGTLAGNWDCH